VLTINRQITLDDSRYRARAKSRRDELVPVATFPWQSDEQTPRNRQPAIYDHVGHRLAAPQ
jgi:hypothetical protein